LHQDFAGITRRSDDGDFLRFHFKISTATFVTAFLPDFHKTFWKCQRPETELAVKPVRVPRAEQEPPQTLQLWMREHRGDKLLAETVAAL
jgi:hypothetical protein